MTPEEYEEAVDEGGRAMMRLIQNHIGPDIKAWRYGNASVNRTIAFCGGCIMEIALFLSILSGPDRAKALIKQLVDGALEEDDDAH